MRWAYRVNSINKYSYISSAYILSIKYKPVVYSYTPESSISYHLQIASLSDLSEAFDQDINIDK